MGSHNSFYAVRHASVQILNLVGLHFRKCFAQSIPQLLCAKHLPPNPNPLLMGEDHLPPIGMIPVLFDPAHPVCFGQQRLLAGELDTKP